MSLQLSVFFTKFNKHTSFLCYRINYVRNTFYDTGPRLKFFQWAETLACLILVGKAPQSAALYTQMLEKGYVS
jgi:hypothetical protein